MYQDGDGDSMSAREPDQPSLERRHLLAATAIGIAGATVGTAQAQSSSTTKVDTAPYRVDPSKLKTWTTAKGFQGFIEAAQAKDAQALGVTNQKALAGLAEPIDTGADKLLSPYQGDPLPYAPLQIEYLTRTLTEHVRNCLELRRHGQELEVAGFNQSLGLLLSSQRIAIASEQARLSERSRVSVMGTMYQPQVDKNSGSIASGANGSLYSSEVAQIDNAFIGVSQNEVDAISGFATIDGGSANYLQRTELIKKFFDIELTEAYIRARSVFSGIKHCYPSLAATIGPMPPLTNSGYLDALAIWSKRAAYSLEKTILDRRETTIAVVIGKAGADGRPTVVPGVDFDLSRKAGRFTFMMDQKIIDQAMPGIQTPLLRGLELATWGNARGALDSWDPMRATVKLPEFKVQTPEGGLGYTGRPVLHLPTVSMLNRRDYATSNQDQVHNVNPMGEWEISINNNNLFTGILDNDAKFSALVIFMRFLHA